MLTDDLRKIHHTLLQLGLIESEVNIFLLGLEHGALSITQLAGLSDMGRVTVHEIVRRLISKGLFLETYSGKKRLVYPNQVDALERLVEDKQYEVMQLEKAAKKASSLLRALQLQSEHFPSTRFYKGQEGISRMLSEIRQDKEDIAIMSDSQHFYELIDNDFLEQSLKLRNQKKIGVQLLFPTGFEHFTYTQGTYQQQLSIKSLPNQEGLKGGMTLWGDKAALHCYEGKFISTTILEDNNLVGILKFLFDQIRTVAKSY